MKSLYNDLKKKIICFADNENNENKAILRCHLDEIELILTLIPISNVVDYSNIASSVEGLAKIVKTKDDLISSIINCVKEDLTQDDKNNLYRCYELFDNNINIKNSYPSLDENYKEQLKKLRDVFLKIEDLLQKKNSNIFQLVLSGYFKVNKKEQTFLNYCCEHWKTCQKNPQEQIIFAQILNSQKSYEKTNEASNKFESKEDEEPKFFKNQTTGNLL